MRKFAYTTILLTLFSCTSDVNLESVHQEWLNSGIDSYNILYKIECDCNDNNKTIQAEVKKNKIVKVINRRVKETAIPEIKLTVDDLFEYAFKLENDKKWSGSYHIDEVYGYPRILDINKLGEPNSRLKIFVLNLTPKQ